MMGAKQNIVANCFQIHSSMSTMPNGAYLAVKRATDVVVSLLALIVLSPLLALISLAIAIESPGGVLFAQHRMGYDLKRGCAMPFFVFKFRSMRADASESSHVDFVRQWIRDGASASEAGSANGAPIKLQRDHRITRFGALMRRLSLDELPQLWNVLMGDMSLVGPRPVPVYEVAEYSTWHRARLEAIPGMTGLWQTVGRAQVSVDDMVRLDIEYIQTRSLATDLRILLMTLPAVIVGRGAE